MGNRYRFRMNVSGGGSTYYYSQNHGAGTPGTCFLQTGYMAYARINVPTGTCTQLSVYENFGGTCNVKGGLYNSSRALLLNLGVLAITGNVWNNWSLSQAVSAGDIFLGWLLDAATVGFEMNTLTTDEGRTTDSVVTYAGGPADPLPANLNPPGGTMTARALVG